jgi:hypothetical protein
MVTGDCASSTAMPDKTSCDDFAPMTGDSFQVEAGSFSSTVAKMTHLQSTTLVTVFLSLLLLEAL